jgi:predicted flap endonuclease-1-like 5' DNA nuclease
LPKKERPQCIQKGKLEVSDLKSINGVGDKTVAKAKDLLSFEAV